MLLITLHVCVCGLEDFLHRFICCDSCFRRCLVPHQAHRIELQVLSGVVNEMHTISCNAFLRRRVFTCDTETEKREERKKERRRHRKNGENEIAEGQ